MLRLTRGFTKPEVNFNSRVNLAHVLTRGFWRGTTRHELTGEIPRVNLVVNSNLCLEQPALSVFYKDDKMTRV